MTLLTMSCPACSHPLPPETKPNQLTTCPACGSTLYLSDWQVGKDNENVVVGTPTRVYTMTDLVGKDDLCNTYRALYKADDKEWQGIFRMARNPQDNDLVQNEAQTLYHLQTKSDYDEFRLFLPLIMESFLYHDATLISARHANIMALHEKINAPNELYSLQEIHDYYPSGIDPRDMAWMWRRLLYVLGFVHHSGVVHGAVLPAHIMIEPKEHKLMLSGWGFSVRDPEKSGAALKAVSQTYDKWYPAEVFEKKVPNAGLDIFLAARSMMYLIGADPLDEPYHRYLDKPLQRYFTRCVNPKPRERPQDAWKLLSEFDTIIEQLWGPRKFRVFTMPYKS